MVSVTGPNNSSGSQLRLTRPQAKTTHTISRPIDTTIPSSSMAPSGIRSNEFYRSRWPDKKLPSWLLGARENVSSPSESILSTPSLASALIIGEMSFFSSKCSGLVKDKPKGYKFFPELGHTKSALYFMNESISDFHSSKGTGNKYFPRWGRRGNFRVHAEWCKLYVWALPDIQPLMDSHPLLD
jgi:hypothetical protein